MGKLTKMDVIYDTGSDWLIVEGADCVNCEGNTYDISLSLQTGTAVKTSSDIMKKEFGSAKFLGETYTDEVCLLFSACVENFEFFYVVAQDGMEEPVDGNVGMARNEPFFFKNSSESATQKLYVEALVESDIIPVNKFSFYFTEKSEMSWVDLGEPQQDNVRFDGELIELQMITDYFWSDFCQGVAIGDTSEENTFGWEYNDDYRRVSTMDHSIYTVFDTGSTAIMVSGMYYESFVRAIFARVEEGINWFADDGIVYTECDATYPSIFFMFQERWIEVRPRDYIHIVSDNTCIFLFLPNDQPFNILGMPIFNDYYTVHDPDAGTISWAPHNASTKDNLQPGVKPSGEQLMKLFSISNTATEEEQSEDGSAT